MTLSKDEIVMVLYKNQVEKGTIESVEVPEEIITMVDGPKKRLYIMIYFLIRIRKQINLENTIRIIRNLENILYRELKEAEEEIYVWKEEFGLSPQALSVAAILNIKRAFEAAGKKVTFRESSNLREVFRAVAIIRDIPSTPDGLSSLPLMNYRMVCFTMEYAWGRVVGVPIDPGCARVMARLGWIDEKIIATLRSDSKTQKGMFNQLFQPNTWGYVYPTLKTHSRSICFVGRKQLPNCSDCILNQICPSSNINRKVHKYLNTLQKKGYFPETIEREPEKEPEDLASCTETESEDYSDL